MDAAQYREALEERARYLYCILMMDPFRVPLLDPRNSDTYPMEIRSEMQMQFWLELTEELQVLKPGRQ